MTNRFTIEDKEKVLELVQKNAFNYFLLPLSNEILQDKDVIFTTIKKDFILFEKISDSFFSSLTLQETIDFLEILLNQNNFKSEQAMSRYNNPTYIIYSKLLLAPDFLKFTEQKYPGQDISNYNFYKENTTFIEEAITFMNYQIMKKNVMPTELKSTKVVKF